MTQKELWVYIIDNVRMCVTASKEEYDESIALLESQLSPIDIIFVYKQTAKLLAVMVDSAKEVKDKLKEKV